MHLCSNMAHCSMRAMLTTPSFRTQCHFPDSNLVSEKCQFAFFFATRHVNRELRMGRVVLKWSLKFCVFLPLCVVNVWVFYSNSFLRACCRFAIKTPHNVNFSRSFWRFPLDMANMLSIWIWRQLKSLYRESMISKVITLEEFLQGFCVT